MLNVLTQISRFAIPAIFLMVVSLGIQGGSLCTRPL